MSDFRLIPSFWNQRRQSPRRASAYAGLLTLILLSLPACQILDTAPSAGPDNILDSDYQGRLAAIDHWRLSGKLGVRREGQAESAAIQFWLQEGDEYDIQVASVFLGLGATRIQGNSDRIRIQQGDETPLLSENPHGLVRAVTGWTLPLEQLPWWIRGTPAPGTAFQWQTKPDSLVLRQAGWTVIYEQFQEVAESGNTRLTLPRKVRLLRPDLDLQVRAVIAQWEILE